MSKSEQDDRPSAPAPSIAARRAIRDGVIREFIAAFHQAQRFLARVEQACGDDDELDDIPEIVLGWTQHAETLLTRAILSPTPDHRGDRAEKRYWPSRGVRCDGRLYVVRPISFDDGARIGEKSSGGGNAMALTVLDETSIADVGTIADVPTYQPDWSAVDHLDQAAVEQAAAAARASRPNG